MWVRLYQVSQTAAFVRHSLALSLPPKRSRPFILRRQEKWPIVSLNKRMPTRLFKRNKILTCGKYFWATLIDAQQLKKKTMSSRRGTRGSGPPEEMIKRLKDERMRKETLRQLRARNALVGASILAVMGGIYLYTLKATRQENFLDKEFDTPGAGVQRSNQPSKN